jgi:hypothetical protein
MALLSLPCLSGAIMPSRAPKRAHSSRLLAHLAIRDGVGQRHRERTPASPNTTTTEVAISACGAKATTTGFNEMTRASAPSIRLPQTRQGQPFPWRSAAVSLAVQSAIPALREAPHWIGSLRSKGLWHVHLYVLCRANPKASVCLVSPVHSTKGPPEESSSTAMQSMQGVDVMAVPMRFHPDSRSGLHLRPSCGLGDHSRAQHWLAEPESVEMIAPQQIHGTEVMVVRRKQDGLEFFAAQSESVAEVIAGELVRTIPLWRNLASSRPSFRQAVLDRIL